jgi:hypothetical protein
MSIKTKYDKYAHILREDDSVISYDTATASANKEGKVRYRTDANNSYLDVCMKTGSSSYSWVNIKTNTW